MFLCRLDYTSCPDNPRQALRHIVLKHRPRAEETMFEWELLRIQGVSYVAIKLTNDTFHVIVLKLCMYVSCIWIAILDQSFQLQQMKVSKSFGLLFLNRK